MAIIYYPGKRFFDAAIGTSITLVIGVTSGCQVALKWVWFVIKVPSLTRAMHL